MSQPDSGGWCRTAIFSESPQAISPENQPVWLVVVATESSEFEEKGIELLNLVERTYHSLELKSAEALFQTLAQAGADYPSVSVLAGCITLTTITIMTKNQAKAVLFRGEKTHLIAENQTNTWRATEGNWQKNDVWWVEAGDSGMVITELKDEEILSIFSQENHARAGLLVRLSEAGMQINETESVASAPATSGNELAHKQKKRRIFILGWLVLILLVTSVFFGSKAREKKVTESQYQQLSTQLEQSIAVTEALYQSNQIQAREQMRTTLNSLEAAKSQFETDEAWLSKWQALYDRANQVYQTISGEKSLTEVPAWYPLASIREGFSGKQMAACGENLVIWDETTGTLVKIDIENKRNDIVAGGAELAGLKHVACDGNRAVALNGTGIVDISLTRKNTTMLIETDQEWVQPELVGLYNNNVYVVDVGSQLIWRYPAITGGVGAKQNWFGQGVTLSGTDYVRMAIDGQLWLLQSLGKISRFTRGAPQSFSITGLDQPLGGNTPSFAVDGERDLVAVLDSNLSRIIITTKNGEYRKQIDWAGLATATDIAFFPNKDTLFVLNNGTIYAIDF